MDGHMHDPSDLSSMDDEVHHQYIPQDATAKDTEEDNNTDDGDETDRIYQRHPWYYQPQYSRFWQHYAAMQSWMQTYVSMHRNKSSWYPSISYPHIMNRCGTYPQYSTNYHHPQPPFTARTSSFSNWNFNSQRNENQYSRPAPCDYNNAPQPGTHYHDNEYRRHEYSNNEESSDESMEIEISKEMIEFFKTSQKFREERDRAKAKSEKKAKKDRKNPVKEEEKKDCRAPVERPDKGRRKGMKVLYGKHSARIHSMETAMQMQFDRSCDRFQPAFWPIVPLKM